MSSPTYTQAQDFNSVTGSYGYDSVICVLSRCVSQASTPPLTKVRQSFTDISRYLCTRKMAYKYQRLQDLEAEIRVAVIHPGSFQDEIHVSFRVTRLENGENVAKRVRMQLL
jgi:hypothetical protein